jgi:hypothetical protein
VLEAAWGERMQGRRLRAAVGGSSSEMLASGGCTGAVEAGAWWCCGGGPAEAGDVRGEVEKELFFTAFDRKRTGIAEIRTKLEKIDGEKGGKT